MAGKKENIKALFTNTRSRVIIVLTVILMLSTIVVGYIKFKSPSVSDITGTRLSTGPGGIKSIPGAINQTAQYAYLQEKQNIEQAKKAAKTGSSAIPTIIRSQGFGAGIEAVGPQGGKGPLGFSELAQQDTSGPQQSLWIQQLKDSGCSKASVSAVLNQGAGLSDLKTVCSCAQLRENGYRLVDLEPVCSCPDLKAAGFNAAQLKASGYSAERLYQCGFNACELQAAGFTAQELKEAGLSNGELKGAGFSDADIGTAGAAAAVTAADIRKAGCQPNELKQLRDEGVTAGKIRRISGCSAAQLKAAGYTAKELKQAGFTPAELAKAGFTPAQLRNAGIEPVKKGIGNCSMTSLQAARAKGESASTIRETLGCSADSLKAAGYDAAQLKAAGFTAAQLKAAGFNAAQLKDAGFNAAQLRDAGFTAKQLKDVGFTPAQLKDAGFTAKELKEAGFTPAQLKDAGFSTKELKDAGFTAAELKNAGFTPGELRDAGFTVPESSLQGLNGINGETGLTIPSLGGGSSPQSIQAAANERQLKEILDRQKTHMAEQKYQQKIQQRSSLMTSAANQALQGWKTGFTQVLVTGPNLQKEKATENTDVTNTAASAIENVSERSKTGAAMSPAIHAGEVLFAVLDTSVNSDEPGPILATIVSGRFKGAKLIGSFSLPENADKMVISFNMMSVPGASKTTSINAYAIDPNTARTALSSRTDHHYLLRYGSLFASTFIEGFGNAFQSAGTTVTIGGTGVVQTTTVQSGVGRSVLENAVIGLATLGKSWGQVAMKQVNLPVTVDVFSGTGLGILFTQDVASV